MPKGCVLRRGFASKFYVGRGLGQNIPDITETLIQFNNVIFDLLQEYNTTTPNVFQPKRTGYYKLDAHAIINNLNVGDTFRLSFLINGVVGINSAYNQANSLNEEIALSISGLYRLTPTDIVGVVVWHNFGAVRAIQGNWYETNFCGFRVD